MSFFFLNKEHNELEMNIIFSPVWPLGRNVYLDQNEMSLFAAH
jgi:hypothetical protein